MVGASLALALAPAGVRVGLIEAIPAPVQREPHYDDRATALSAGGQKILASMGVWQRVAQLAAPIRRVHISEQGRMGVAWLEADELALDALGWVIENPRLVVAFQTALEDSDTVLFQPAKVVHIAQDDDGVTVTLEQGGRQSTLRTRLLVGADGARSMVREAIGVSASQHDYGQTAIVANLTPQLDHQGVAYERFTKDGPLAFLPLSEQRCAIVWSVPTAEAEHILSLPEHAFCERINHLFGERLGPIERLGQRQAWPLRRTRADAQRRGRVVLVGNAAHSLHPIAGQGFNLSLRDVMALADTVSTGMDEHALADWEQGRRTDQQRVSGFTDRLNNLFLLDLPLAGSVRGVGIAAFGLSGPVRRLIARYGAGLGVPLR